MSRRKPKSSAVRKRATRTTSGEPHDGPRGRFAVVVSVVRRPDGSMRVVMDDARPSGPGRWVEDAQFTYRDYPAEAFMETDIDPSEFESMGVSILARLVAYEKVNG